MYTSNELFFKFENSTCFMNNILAMYLYLWHENETIDDFSRSQRTTPRRPRNTPIRPTYLYSNMKCTYVEPYENRKKR